MDWELDKHKPEHKKERDKAKKGKYTLFFGAGDAKFGKDMGLTAKDGKRARANLYKNLPRFEKLINQLKEASKKGWLKSLDNRKIWMRKGDDGKVLEHKALNTWVQCAGALVAKVGLLYVKKRLLVNPKYDAKSLIWYHDEGQWQVKEEYAEEFAKEVEKCFEAAGDYFKLKCPIKGSATVGMNWAETH
jgi:DNA polymerase I-like protein with 3'-5' exonuclease and polymerase domains